MLHAGMNKHFRYFGGATYSPFSVVIVGPPLGNTDGMTDAMYHELVHVKSTDSQVANLMRSIVEGLHEGIVDLAFGQVAGRLMGEKALVPSFSNFEFMRLRIQLLHEIMETTRLAEEACALYLTVRAMLRSGETFRGKPDERTVRAYEESCAKVYSYTGSSFQDIYRRFKNVARKGEELAAILTMYALNCRVDNLVDQDVVRPYPEGNGISVEVERRKNAELRRAIKRVQEGDWESPRQRFEDAIAAAEKLPVLIEGMSEEAIFESLHDDLPGIHDAYERRVSDPRHDSIPDFRHSKASEQLMTTLARRQWKEGNGPLHRAYLDGAPVGPLLDEVKAGRLGKKPAPLIYLEASPEHEGYISRSFSSDPEDMRLAFQLIEREFLLEQLSTGRGLTCVYDILHDIDHPPLAADRNADHRRLMEGLWRATEADSGVALDTSWSKPACI